MNYPQDFLWGAAASSHQVEGNNINNDWWQWEEQGRTKNPSGAACDHFNRFDEDFQLAASMGHNAHRLSIEWSRIEPKEGEFDADAIAHYKNVLASLKSKSITPVITLHHFTNPLWFQYCGGWLNPDNVDFFARYVKEVVLALGEDVRYWITINEPMVYALYSYCEGLWPPGGKSYIKGFRVVKNMIQAHRRAYEDIHIIYRSEQWETPMVGFAKNYRPFCACPKRCSLFGRLGVFWRNSYFNRYYLNNVKSTLDFIGVNYYEMEYDSTDPALPYGLFGGNCTQAHRHFDRMNQLGWGMCPRGLTLVLDWLAKYNMPILITENGTCEVNDTWRQSFIEKHIDQIDQAIDKKIPVFGYLYWSLLDNFEWHHGSEIRFGLIDVNYKTFQRTVRVSALRYKELIEERKGI